MDVKGRIASFVDRRFFVGAALGALGVVLIVNISALVLARQMWLAERGGLVFHRKLPDNGLPRISIPKSLGRPLFEWNLKSVDGAEVKLSSWGDKVLFVNLWATWCAPCVAELPSIQKLQASTRSDSVAFLLITDEDPHTVKQFLSEHPVSVPVYIRAAELPAPLEYAGVPVTYVLDQHRRIVYQHVGVGNWDTPDSIRFVNDLASR
jgi:thiol-disulfide isomerase/thioredoxin